MQHLLYGLLLYFFFNFQPENRANKFPVNFYTQEEQGERMQERQLEQELSCVSP